MIDSSAGALCFISHLTRSGKNDLVREAANLEGKLKSSSHVKQFKAKGSVVFKAADGKVIFQLIEQENRNSKAERQA